MTAHSRAWLQIHVCVLLWGVTAILGKLITLPALPLVWWRMLLVTAVLMLWPPLWRAVWQMPRRLAAIHLGIGALVTLHWLTFYGSIKLSNASVAATCLALAPVFVALVEPLIARRRFNATEFLLAVLVLPGVALVVGGTPTGMQTGIAVGIFSAFIVGIFSSLNKRFIGTSPALAVTGVHMAAGTLLLPVAALALPADSVFVLPGARDAWLLATLAFVCTLLPYSLALVALRHLSAFATTLAVNLEPVYAIILAVAFLGEQRDLTLRFYVGVAIIVTVVFAYPWLSRRFAGTSRVAAGPVA
jgi:drug/metabolite transporter (DMT)-like permease